MTTSDFTDPIVLASNMVRRHHIGDSIASPYGLATLSSLVFIVACIFPPHVYSYLMGEPDLIFLDIRSIVFYELCVGAFVCGVALVSRVTPKGSCDDIQFANRIGPATFILIPLVCALAINLLSIISVVRNGELVSLLSSGEGEAVKEALPAQGATLLTSTGLMGVTWWAIWRQRQLRLTRMSAFAVRVVIGLALASSVVSAYLKLNRGELMSTVVGLTVTLIVCNVVTRKATLRATLGITALSLLCFLGLFVLFVIPRGVDDLNRIVTELTACTLASYNRLSAVLSGSLRYRYGGTGVYLSGFLPFNNLFNKIVPLREVFGWPSFYDVWMSEFEAVQVAGLNSGSIWSGTFGYIFSDLGWLTPLFVFSYGLLNGWAWQSIRRGQTAGIVLYPWCALSVLFWSGINLLLSTNLVVLVIASLLLASYEFVLMGRKPLCRQCWAT